MLASIVTPAEIEHRRLVARHLFDALSAQYPNKYVTLVLPQYPRRAKAPLVRASVFLRLPQHSQTR